MTEPPINPLAGMWQPVRLEKMIYGPDTVKNHLISCMPSESSRAFIITGSSLATKSPLIKQVEKLLGERHAGTYSQIGQHAPDEHVKEATNIVEKDFSINTLISIGGGSPIDATKSIIYRLQQSQSDHNLTHITIPTTLAAAECSHVAGTTTKDLSKTLAKSPSLIPAVILYDATFAQHTPTELFLSTGIRALDHAIELLYNTHATEAPCKSLCLMAIKDLFDYLPKFKQDPKDNDVITKCQLAAFNSLVGMGINIAKSGIGLSHILGYKIGSPFGVPHGITSCMTLAKVVRMLAEVDAAASQIARAGWVLGLRSTGSVEGDTKQVANEIEELVKNLGLVRRLGDWGVNKGDTNGLMDGVRLELEGDTRPRLQELVDSLL